MDGYSAREVAKLLDVSAREVRSWVQAGLLAPHRNGRGALRFTFQDLVLLRAAKGLLSAEIAPRRVRGALRKLRAQLPEGRPLSGVAIAAEGNRIVVRDGRRRWNPESGQALFDFDVADLARRAAPVALRAAERERVCDASRWFDHALELEPIAAEEAIAAYQRALEIDEAHADAHLNLGRLLHESRKLDAAEKHYRRCLELLPNDATPAFNLGVLLEDSGDRAGAIAAYRTALERDARLADAHFNLGRLYEQAGRPQLAIRHFIAYRKLTKR